MKKVVLFIILISVLMVGFLGYDYVRFYDGKLHIIFCNVGQGDAVVIRTPSDKYILYDGGPDDKVLNCLARHSPFWQRKIHLIILSHPHLDHFSGMYYVIDRYNTGAFATEKLSNESIAFYSFSEEVSRKHIQSKFLYAGDKFLFSDGIELNVLGPSKEYLQQTSPNGMIGESGEFASLVVGVVYKNFSLLLTGDSQVNGLDEAFRNYEGLTGMKERGIIGGVDVLQVPHHGSKYGLDDSLVSKLNPKLAVISVGKNNYGHPSKEIIEILKNKGIKILRTDESGDVEIVSDGKKWGIKK